MKKLFIDYTPSDRVILDGEQARHIGKSLRMKKGDMLNITDGSGETWGCMIDIITDSTVELEVCYKVADKSEPSCSVTLYQGFPKGSKFEDIIQKCVELGVTKIVPVLTARSISRPKEAQFQRKLERFNKIALEAAQQSGRGIVPEVCNMVSLKNAIKDDDAKTKILFYEGGGIELEGLINHESESVSIYIGPEGGFEPSEAELLESNGAIKTSLGPRILRTQTAPVAAISCIMLLSGNMK